MQACELSLGQLCIEMIELSCVPCNINRHIFSWQQHNHNSFGVTSCQLRNTDLRHFKREKEAAKARERIRSVITT